MLRVVLAVVVAIVVVIRVVVAAASLFSLSFFFCLFDFTLLFACPP